MLPGPGRHPFDQGSTGILGLLLVAASIAVEQLLRLGPHLVDVPISAMLVLGVGYPGAPASAGYDRMIETVLGAVVGVLVNLAFPPKVRIRYAGQAVQRLAEEIAALLNEAAECLGAGAGAAAVRATHSGNWFPTGTGWFTTPSVDRSLATSG